MVVICAGVVLASSAREGRDVRGHKGARHVFVERLSARVERVKRAELAAPTDLGIPQLRVVATVERAPSIARPLALPDDEGRLAA